MKSIYIDKYRLSILSIFLSPVIREKHLYVQFILLVFPTVMAGIIYSMRSKGYLGIILSGVLFINPVFIELIIPSMSVVALISLCFLILITMAVLFLIIRSFKLCYKQKSILGKLVSMAVLVTFTMEVVLYTITNLGLPIMGSLTLPFISYSGMSTIINMSLIGIMLSVFKSGHIVKDSLLIPNNE